MKKFIVCFIVIFNLTSLSSPKQKVLGYSIIEVHYQLYMHEDTIRKNKEVIDSMILRIGEDISQFFSYHTFYYDSLWTDTNGRAIAERLTLEAFRNRDYSKMPEVRTTHDYIYKNYPEGTITTMTRGLVAGFTFEEEYLSQKWTVTDSVKQILNYTCKQAVCNFRGRQWTAWFSPDIEFSDGPWKFNGLPGLILEIYDKSSDYYYIATEIKEKSIPPLTLYNFHDEEFIPTERSAYLQARYLYLTGEPITEIDLINEVYRGGKKLNYIQRPSRRLLYDFQELDYK